MIKRYGEASKMKKRNTLIIVSLLICLTLLAACNTTATSLQSNGGEVKGVEDFTEEVKDKYIISGLDEGLLGLEKIDGSDEKSRDFENRDVDIEFEDIYINEVISSDKFFCVQSRREEEDFEAFSIVNQFSQVVGNFSVYADDVTGVEAVSVSPSGDIYYVYPDPYIDESYEDETKTYYHLIKKTVEGITVWDVVPGDLDADYYSGMVSTDERTYILNYPILDIYNNGDGSKEQRLSLSFPCHESDDFDLCKNDEGELFIVETFDKNSDEGIPQGYFIGKVETKTGEVTIAGIGNEHIDCFASGHGEFDLYASNDSSIFGINLEKKDCKKCIALEEIDEDNYAIQRMQSFSVIRDDCFLINYNVDDDQWSSKVRFLKK